MRKCGCLAKLCYTDKNSFIIYIKLEDVYEDLAEDVEKRFDTSNIEGNRPLHIGKNKRVIILMKYELGGKIMKEIMALRPKIYSYLKDDNHVDKEVKGTKKCVIKQKIISQDYEECLENNKTILRSQQSFTSKLHNVFAEKVNKIALSATDNKRIQTLDGVTTYPYGYEF